MAMKKTGMIDKALASKPVTAAKHLISSAVDAFTDPPLAADLANAPAKKAKRATAQKVSAKKTIRGRNQDRKLVASMQDYEVKYLAQHHGVTQKAVKEAVAKVGNSRSKVEAELKANKSGTSK